MSKCDYCDNTNSCRTCGLTYDDGVNDGRKQAIKELVNAMEKRNRPVPADRLVRGALIYAVDVLERKFADDMTSSHEYLEYLGITTHDLCNIEQAQMILDAMRLLAEALKEGGKE